VDRSGQTETWLETSWCRADAGSLQATELTLEDRITERLKNYQRQLNRLDDEPEVDREAR
jgi:hypothetical protein